MTEWLQEALKIGEQEDERFLDSTLSRTYFCSSLETLDTESYSLPLFTPDLTLEICSWLDVKSLLWFMATCTDFHHFQERTDKLLWGNLVRRDYRFIMEGETARKHQPARVGEASEYEVKKNPKDISETCGSFKKCYAEVYCYLQKKPVSRFVAPYLATLTNFTKKVKYVFSALDMIRGTNSFDGPHILVNYADLVQTNVLVLDYGCNKTVYLHTQICRWSFGIGDIYKEIGLQGSPSAPRTDLRWSCWQTFAPKNEYNGYYLAKITAKNNVLKWTKGGYFSKQWVKVRYFASVGQPFQNPGPYPEVRLKDSDIDERPFYELVYLLE